MKNVDDEDDNDGYAQGLETLCNTDDGERREREKTRTREDGERQQQGLETRRSQAPA
jgi:hypothetical protein